jgi:hypothetical protein
MNTPTKKPGRPKRVGPKPVKKAIFLLVDVPRYNFLLATAKRMKLTVPRLADLALEDNYPGESK